MSSRVSCSEGCRADEGELRELAVGMGVEMEEIGLDGGSELGMEDGMPGTIAKMETRW